MKTKNFVPVIVILILLFFTSCGGSSGGSDAKNVSGSWSGALTKLSDTCTPANPTTLNFTHNVTQNEDAVILITDALFEYLGNLVNDNGFSVDGTRAIRVGDLDCAETSRIEYDGIVDDDDPAAEVEITSTFACAGNNNCRVDYSGTASRVISGVVPTVTPANTPNTGATATPQVTVTPGGALSGGCVDINPNPAADVYQGDGGCGISEALFRFVQESSEGVVTLEPFGENGLTTFVLNSANTSAGSTRRTDLTIKGESGYTCVLACSPPITFTVQCIKEGSTSCTEKF